MLRRFLNLICIPALCAAVWVAAPASADDAAMSEKQKQEIEKIIHDYIMENPQVILDAVQAHQKAQAEAEQMAQQKRLIDMRAQLENAELSPVGGNLEGNVTVVEFFDYRCGYCKRSMEWTMAIPEDHDGKVRVIFKEFPILSPESEKAALAALAAGEQGKYAEMHRELMELDNSSGFTPDEIDAAAKRAGVDVDKMRADMGSVRLQKVIADNKTLARSLGIDGTPAFLIGDTLIPGADQAGVNRMIDEALKQNS